MTTIQKSPEDLESWRRTNNLVYAWTAYLALPASFFLGFAAAHLPSLVWDYPEGSPGPWWFTLLETALFAVVLWLPVGASLVFGRRALRLGSKAAWVPVVLGLVLTLALVAVAISSAFV